MLTLATSGWHQCTVYYRRTYEGRMDDPASAPRLGGDFHTDKQSTHSMHAASAPGLPLPARLQVVHDATPHGARVADIGCDHGMLSAALSTSGRASLVCACDVSPHALLKTARNLERATAAASATCATSLREGDGFASLEIEDNVDTVIMAGIGVPKMEAILTGGLVSFSPIMEGVHTLILKPIAPRLPQMALLRAVLRRRGFCECHEQFTTTEDATGLVRPYITLTARRGSTQRRVSWSSPSPSFCPPVSPPERVLGASPPLRDPSFRMYLQHQRGSLLDGLRVQMEARPTAKSERERRRYEAWIRLIDAALPEAEAEQLGARRIRMIC